MSDGSKDEPPATVERLRADIDAGRLHDKVKGSDPAAAPLGADDEAGGAPPTHEQIKKARETEQGGR